MMVTVALVAAFYVAVSVLLSLISDEPAAAGVAVCLIALIDRLFDRAPRK